MPDPKPELFIVVSREWEDFTERRTDASYEKLDNWADSIGLNGKLDIVAGAWYAPSEGRIYIEERLARAAFKGDPDALALVKHEKGHQERVKQHDHPTTPWGMFWHAWRCGWDYRAGTRSLRRNKRRSPPGFDTWWGQQRALWAQGAIQPQPAPGG